MKPVTNGMYEWSKFTLRLRTLGNSIKDDDNAIKIAFYDCKERGLFKYVGSASIMFGDIRKD
jgi:hypothetical protein